jgi:hypothetical protein
MTFAFALSNIVLGTGAAHLSGRIVHRAAALEWICGLAMITGLAALGVALARY